MRALQGDRQSRRRGRGVLAGLCMLALAASSCTSGGGSASATSDDTPRGGTLQVALLPDGSLENPAFLDPQRPYDMFFRFETELLRCCLVRTLLSHPGLSTEEGGTVLRPDLAADLPQVSRDGLTWTFRLREGLRYAPPLEDMEITASDIVRGIHRSATADVAEGAHGAFYSVIQGYDAYAKGDADTISGLEVIGDHTLRVHLTQVTNDFGQRMSLPASAPIPPSPTEPSAPFGVATGHDHGYGLFLVASGPYMVEGAERLDPSRPAADQPSASGLTPETLTLVRNPSWERATDDLRGAYVDRIELRVMPFPRAERAIDAGTVDLILNGYNSPEQVDRYLADPDLAARVFRVTTDLFVGYGAMNLAVPPFDDVHVRRAVNLAFNAEAFARVWNETPTPGGLGGVTLGEFEHIAPDGTQANLLRDYDPYPFDLDAAREEMTLSAYDEDGDGVCDHPSCDHVFAIDTEFGPEPYTERVWIEALSQIGIALEIRRFPNASRFLQFSADPSRKVALNLGTFWAADYPDASAFFPTHFRADGIGRVPYGNVSLIGARPDQLRTWGYDVLDVPDVDAKIGECLQLFGFAQIRCWAELDQLLMTEVVPWVPQNTLDYFTIISGRVVRFSADQAVGAWAAPDQIALAAGSH